MAHALPATFTFQLLTPAAQLAVGEATYAQIPGAAGSFGVLPGHAPLVALLAQNEPLQITLADGTRQTYTVHGGVAKVTPNGLTILAEQATLA
jgi:F-type H+-transporting ATPase subunit epsilon